MNLRMVPWLVALAALAILLVVNGFRVWPLVGVWIVALTAAWAWGRGVQTIRTWRIATSLVLLPILFLLAFEGGWG